MNKKDASWEKGTKIRGKNPDVWRKDCKGNTIRYGSYGTCGEYGWEIDHKHPVSQGGTNNYRNLQALHWQANRSKGKKYPS
ncbi:HNH endonuclease [Candidatus Gastranaerophilales bacterium]|nr:MAG: HNH endonuclease [Candidatus Gastranaerophilales bacterium]